MSSLYKDAIADARKLREAAEQNAKNRIIEAVTPKLRRLIERQIAEGDELLDDELSGDLLDTEEAMDMLDDELEPEIPEAEPMEITPEPLGFDSDGLGSMEIVDDEESDVPEGVEEFEDESQNKSVHVNITVEGKRNYLLRHRAIRLVKALSEAKTKASQNKIRKELILLRKALIITENRQNKRLANNLSVILKESKTMRRRRNSWLFEGKDGAAGEEIEFDDAGFEEGGDTIEVDAAALEDALGLDAGTISGGASDDEDMDMDDDLDMEDDDMDLDMEDDDLDLGDETYEMMGESDEMEENDESQGDSESRSKKKKRSRDSKRRKKKRKKKYHSERRRRRSDESSNSSSGDSSSNGGDDSDSDSSVEDRRHRDRKRSKRRRRERGSSSRRHSKRRRRESRRRREEDMGSDSSMSGYEQEERRRKRKERRRRKDSDSKKSKHSSLSSRKADDGRQRESSDSEERK